MHLINMRSFKLEPCGALYYVVHFTCILHVIKSHLCKFIFIFTSISHLDQVDKTDPILHLQNEQISFIFGLVAHKQHKKPLSPKYVTLMGHVHFDTLSYDLGVTETPAQAQPYPITLVQVYTHSHG